MSPSDELFPRKGPAAGMDRAMSAIVTEMEERVENQDEPVSGPAADLDVLIKKVANNDRPAFEALYDGTVQQLFSLAMRITRQQSLAEEVISDVYLQVWQQASDYKPERATVMAWLSVLCRSRALDALRRNNTIMRQLEVALDAAPEQADLVQPSDLLQSVEQGSAIQAALGRLTEQQRQLVALAYFRGYTHSELASITNMPIGTVKTQLHRTMGKLKALMSGESDLGGGSDE